MKLLLTSAAASLLAGLLAAGAPPRGPAQVSSPKGALAPNAAASYAEAVQPVLARYCVGCHGGKAPTAGLDLSSFHQDSQVLEHREVWEKVLTNLRSHSMPPPGLPRPTDAEAGQVLSWLEARLSEVGCGDVPPPRRVTLRRLTRLEYRNTIRDLVGIDFRAAEDFPADDIGYGFDNIGDVLSLPPILMERYLSAAEAVVRGGYARIAVPPPSGPEGERQARDLLARFAARAYRRPVAPEEVDRLMGLVAFGRKEAGSLEQGVKLALQAILVSPHFLFKVEREPRGEGDARLSDYELATRLSYFLWSSMPDEELFRLASQGKLRDQGVLEAQVRRMLRDPKVKGFVEGFGDQWLQLRRLRSAAPDPDLFPAFDEELRAAMGTETRLFFEAILREDRSLLDLLDADFTYLNERLARHYGLTRVKGPGFRRVRLPEGSRRGGLLTQASILTLTSNPTRTSPVKRGKWVLEQLLNAAPPPPPPGVTDLSEEKAVVASASLRERMERHRADPACAGCHARMDPIGFSFENYDAIGAWREKDGTFPIDATGRMPDGRRFQGPEEMKAILKGQQREFARCLTEKMLTYALGRGLERNDRCTVDEIQQALERGRYRFSSLILGIARSDPFNLRGVEGAKE